MFLSFFNLYDIKLIIEIEQKKKIICLMLMNVKKNSICKCIYFFYFS